MKFYELKRRKPNSSNSNANKGSATATAASGGGASNSRQPQTRKSFFFNKENNSSGGEDCNNSFCNNSSDSDSGKETQPDLLVSFLVTQKMWKKSGQEANNWKIDRICENNLLAMLSASALEHGLIFVEIIGTSNKCD